jgi:hypothetical protein
VSKLAFPAALAAFVAAAAGAAWTFLGPARAADPAGEVVVWTAADQLRLEEQIAEVEERLLGSQARVGFWDELRARHETVSEVACANLTEHVVAMERRAPKPQAAPRTVQARRAPAPAPRVAAGGPVVAE